MIALKVDPMPTCSGTVIPVIRAAAREVNDTRAVRVALLKCMLDKYM